MQITQAAGLFILFWYATVANFAQLGGGNAFLAAAKPGLEVIAGERDAEPFQSKNVSTNPSKPRCCSGEALLRCCEQGPHSGRDSPGP